jgi:HlyD family secretion protein
VVDEKGLPKSIPVRLGISDGTMIELIAGEIKEGDAVIVGGGSAGADASSPPRFGF